MSSFFSSLADKAQNAISTSPLAGHLPPSLQGRHSQQGEAQQQQAGGEATGQAAGGTSTKSHTFGSIQHHIRTLQMQYSASTPVQKIITTEKGLVLSFDHVCRESKAQSRELYMWGQHEDSDVKDVSDRLAYLNFVHGALAEGLATKLDASRAPLKALRDAENKLAPRRNARTSLETQIGKIEYDQPKGQERKLAELKQQLATGEAEDAAAEKELELLKRKALRESEEQKWAALREYGEKIVLLAEASAPIIGALPSVPPTAAQPYKGADVTASTRASLQQSLDNFKPGTLSHAFKPSVADLKRSDSRSFGETHASELSSIGADEQTVRPTSPPDPSGQAAAPEAHPAATPAIAPVPIPSDQPHSSSPPINPSSLNNSPSPIPASAAHAAVPPAALRSSPEEPSTTQAAPPAPEPTIAETGVPVAAGAEGPGPSSGSLADLKAAHAAKTGSPGSPPTSDATPAAGAGAAPVATHESAEEEKKRLQREERERLLQQGSTPAASGSQTGPQTDSQTGNKHDTAEEEKKRLEQEERERVLHSSDGNKRGKDGKGGDEPTPPPYQDF